MIRNGNIEHWGLIKSSLIVVLSGSFLMGCGDPDAARSTHTHHGAGHVHGHSHSHAKPLHGGQLVAIGHTHDHDLATHFHAEIMPLQNNTILFHLLRESTTGDTQDFPIESSDIPAMISIKNRESFPAESTFRALGESDMASAFALTVPEQIRGDDTFLVVVPMIQLGGMPQNFSFSVTRVQSDTQESAANKAIPMESLEERPDE